MVVRNVIAIDVTGAAPRGGVSIVVRDGRIATIVPAGQEPAADVTIDGGGLFAIPGLIDAHVHVESWMPAVLLRYGVTSIRDLHNDAAGIFPMAREDSPARPRIVASGPLIDGRGSFWKNAIQVGTVGEARAHGADAVLLIAECLDDCQMRSLYRAILDLGMTPLVVLHDDNTRHVCGSCLTT